MNDSAKFGVFRMRKLEWLSASLGSNGVSGMGVLSGLLVVCLLGIAAGSVSTDCRGDWSWDPDEVGKDGLPRGRPLIIGHRGSCGMYPEHTALSHEEAAKQGADVLECDMVLTKDLEVICSHESWISGVSNVNDNGVGPEHEDFSGRLSTVNFTSEVDPDSYYHDVITDFFVFDFTLAELKTLRRKQSRSDRDPTYDWHHSFLTLKEFLAIASKYKCGIYPEFKQLEATNKVLASRNITTTFEEVALGILSDHGYVGPDDPCFLQCFELNHLLRLGEKTHLRRIFLMEDLAKATPHLFRLLQTNGVFGVGVWKRMLVEVQDGESGDPNNPKDGHIKRINTDLVQEIKNHQLALHVYTFRNEPRYLNWDDGQDYVLEYERFLNLGVEGFFTDFPQSLRNFLKTKMSPLGKTSSDALSRSPSKSSGWSVTYQAVAIATLITVLYFYFMLA